MTDDLISDRTPITKVLDYKKYFETFLVNNVEQLTQIRKIIFNKNGIFATNNLLSETFDININLIKPNINVEKFDFKNLAKAYEGFRPIKQAKYNDVKKLLQYIIIPSNVEFYKSLVPLVSEINISKSKLRAYDLLLNPLLICKCKCMRLCECKKSSKTAYVLKISVEIRNKICFKSQTFHSYLYTLYCELEL